ncbi:MAG: dehydratase [Hyphomicrobiales bacterium]|nr:dehydratase [Hyphomicrobiales bacterium]
MNSTLQCFEDFPVGRVLEYGAYDVTKEEIVAFATAFDPQPFHLDEEAGARSMLGGLAASGWHTCAILMRLSCDGFLHRADGRGAPGVSEVKWLKPVRPGDMLGVRAEVLSARVSQSRPSIGLLEFRFDLHDLQGVVLMSQTNFVMMGRRGHQHEVTKLAMPPEDAPVHAAPQPEVIPHWAQIEIGKRIVLGSKTFSADEIIAFAQLYDPQPFHTDPEASKTGPFGALAASGWHTAAAWMRAMVDARHRSDATALARGEKPVAGGPSPGFVNLKWMKPVYAGDTITFDSTPLEKRITSRPGWGLMRSRNAGVNQYGVQVYEFESNAFWKIEA